MVKKPIRCLKLLEGCGSVCTEIRHQEMILRRSRKSQGKAKYLYYYSCPQCGIEWIHDTLNHEVHPVSDGYLEKLKKVYRLETLTSQNSPSVEPANNLPKPPRPSGESGNIKKKSKNSIGLKLPGYDEPKAIPRIKTLSGYNAALKKVVELIETRQTGVSMRFDVLSTLVAILEYELRKDKIHRGIFTHRSKKMPHR